MSENNTESENSNQTIEVIIKKNLKPVLTHVTIIIIVAIAITAFFKFLLKLFK